MHARRVVSDVPHARIVSIDTSEAEKVPGVRAIFVLDRQLLEAELRNPGQEAGRRYPTIRYMGQPIAGIAAETQRAADEAARRVHITYQRLSHVTALTRRFERMRRPCFPGRRSRRRLQAARGASGLPQRGNARGPDTGRAFGLPRGDVARALAEADVVVDAEYRTQVQTHVPMETHGIVADWRDDLLTIYASTQFTSSVRDEAAEMFNLPKHRVRVISDFTGGGFGAKYGIGNFGLLAINLSRQAGAAVRLMLDRREEHVSVGNRPGEPAFDDRGETRRHAHSDSPQKLRQWRRRGWRRRRVLSFDDLPVPERQHRALRCLHERWTVRGVPGARPGSGHLRPGAVARRSRRAAGDQTPVALRDRIHTSGSDECERRGASNGGSAPSGFDGGRASTARGSILPSPAVRSQLIGGIAGGRALRHGRGSRMAW